MESPQAKVQDVVSPSSNQPAPVVKPDLVAVNSEGKGRTLVYALLILLILAMLGAGAYFLLSTNQIVKAPATSQPYASTEVKTTSPSPSLNPSEQAAQDQSDLNAIENDTSTKDFSVIDQDLSNL